MHIRFLTGKFLIKRKFQIKSVCNLVLPVVEETLKFAIQLERKRKFLCVIQNRSMEELLRMDTRISFPLLVMPIKTFSFAKKYLVI